MDSLVQSSDYLDMPVFDKDELMNCVRQLLLLDKGWILQQEASQLYTRICHISTDKTLGVRTT